MQIEQTPFAVLSFVSLSFKRNYYLQVMDLTPNEMGGVHQHLDHTKNVHELHYQQMVPYIEKVKIAKLLLVQDLGLQDKYVNKKLDDIDFPEIIRGAPEPVPPAPPTAPPTAPGNDSGSEMDIHSDHGSDVEDEIKKTSKRKRQRRKPKETKRKSWSRDEVDELKLLFSENYKTLKTPKMSLVSLAVKKSKDNDGLLQYRPSNIIQKKMFNVMRKLRDLRDLKDK